jgi:membrane protein YdbS with pleckstrin-like domain
MHADADHKACPYCHERIRAEALKCRWCGEMLEGQGAASGAPGAPEAPLGKSSAPPEERTLYEGSGSQWLNVLVYMLCGAVEAAGLVLAAIGLFESEPWKLWVGLVLVVAASAYALRSFLAVRYVRYNVTTRRIQVERGWLTRHIDQIDFVRVRDMDLHQGMLDRLFDIGTITVYARDATTPTFQIRGVVRPRGVFDLIQREALTTIRQRGFVEV